MKFAFVCTGKKPLSAESAEYFLDMGFVLGNVVGVDEDVVQIYDDNDVDHIHKDVINKLFKVAGALVSPSGIINHSKEP